MVYTGLLKVWIQSGQPFHFDGGDILPLTHELDPPVDPLPIDPSIIEFQDFMFGLKTNLKDFLGNLGLLQQVTASQDDLDDLFSLCPDQSLSDVLPNFLEDFQKIEVIGTDDEGDWWSKLSQEAQDQYLKEHPNSEKAKNAKKQEELRSVVVSQKQELDNLSIQFFGRINPSIEDLKAFSKTNKEKFKEWSNFSNWHQRAEKELLISCWNDKFGAKKVSTKQVKAFLHTENLRDPIPDGFEGKVSLGGTPQLMFNYHTSEGLMLVGTPGRDCYMNPKYDPNTDSTYYCTAKPAGFSEAAYDFYTYNNRRQAQGAIFAANTKIAQEIGAARTIWYTDMENPDDWTVNACGALCALADYTCGRMGNSGSEIQGKYGLHNLKGSHIKKYYNRVQISYVGKDGVSQFHEVTEPKLAAYLLSAKAWAGNDGYLFATQDGGPPINPQTVNTYLRKSGFSGTFHRFRNFHGSRIFAEEMQKFLQKNKQGQTTAKQVVDALNQAADRVAGVLGNQRSAALGSYIDSALVANWFSHYNVDPPQGYQTLLKASYLGSDPDEDSD